VLNVLVLAALIAVALVAYGVTKDWSVRRRGLQHLYWQQGETAVMSESAVSLGRLARWLSLAGYRRQTAPALFLVWSLAALVLGVILGQLYRMTVLGLLLEMVSGIPGGMGEVFAAILKAGQWIALAVVASLPTLVVRAARRSRVRQVEQDLPLTLDLFATMAEAGLGFDGALEKIISSERGNRPLKTELVNFQRDMLAGVPRFQAMARLGRRVEVSSLTAFTSAVIQAEQIGASMAETLRHQAEDLRSRRRESALILAQALPVKLVFPLVLCFLPGIFVSTLAPVIYQMIQVTNSVLRSGGR
jgi:tight adherence protein C